MAVFTAIALIRRPSPGPRQPPLRFRLRHVPVMFKLRLTLTITTSLSESHLISRGGGQLALGAGQNLAARTGVQILNGVSFFGQHLNGGILVDGDGAAGNEDLLGGTVLLVHGDDSGLQDS